MPATELAPALPETYALYLKSFVRALRAENAADKTIATYSDAVRQLGEFLSSRGMPTRPSDITREHVEEFIASQR